MVRWAWPTAFLLIAAGALAGYLSVPHYRPPRSADEARLRERAVEFYRASRRFDMQGMIKLYSPARQLSDTVALNELIAKRNADVAGLKDSVRQEFELAAAAVSSEQLALKIEGNWAVSGGRADLPERQGRTATSVPLENVVWVRSDGDWWIYFLHPAELSCYGNPPDFALQHVSRRRPDAELTDLSKIDLAKSDGEQHAK
jgi:hypothetical protein